MPTRAEKALATRRRMVRAAYDLFCVRGYGGTTIAAIADRAGVAVPTVYYTFGTKAALLAESLGAAIVGFDRWHEPPQDPAIEELLPWHGWWEDFLAAPDSARALDIFLANGAGVLERAGPLVAALHGAVGDPEAEEVLRVGEERRVDTYREVVQVIAAKPGGLREGLSVQTATDILLALFSAHLHSALHAGRGWSQPRTARFLSKIVVAQLIGTSNRSSGEGGIRTLERG